MKLDIIIVFNRFSLKAIGFKLLLNQFMKKERKNGDNNLP